MTNTATLMVFDNYEISPCRRFEEPDSPGRFYFELCEPAKADVWTLYGHIKGEGVEAIGDFATRDAAEEIYFRITGQPFTGSYQATAARLRLMHTAPELLESLIDLVGERDIGAAGHCHKCGRQYLDEDDEDLVLCPADDCAANMARAVIARLTPIK